MAENINYSRCCQQPICTECFVQIKRSDLNLDPCACPFCVEPDFGVVYSPTVEIPDDTTQQVARRKSLSHLDSLVVSSDAIRPTFISRQQELAITRAAAENQRTRLAQSLASSGSGGISIELSGAATAAASLVETLQGRF